MKAWNTYTSKELKAGGWLRRQLEIQAKGLCGNLDKIWPDVRDSAWIGGDREGWERVPYWLDGFIPMAYLLENEELIQRAKRYIDAIVEKQEEDGWICPCPKEERANYDTWAVLLITKVLTVYYECSADERIPQVIYAALKNFYTLLAAGEIKLFDWGRFRWYEGFVAIQFLYGRCHEEWLLKLAAILHEQGVDHNELVELWKRPLNLWRLETHIVNLVMMLKYEAISCDLLGKAYADRAEALHELLRDYNGTPVGLFTGDECLSGLSPIQGTELCAVVEQMYCYEWLYAYTGDSKWAERLELLAFNALPATISDDMWAHQYVQMSNQIACERFPGKSLFRTNEPDAHMFGLEPNFGCCTSNFGQGWPKLALSAFMHRDGTIISCVPVPSELTTEDTHIVLQTEYPFKNRFTYTVETKADFRLEIRVPSFACGVTVNGQPMQGETLSFDIQAGTACQLVVAYETHPEWMERPYDLRTVRCGSLVFSVPIEYETVMHEYEKNGVERKFPYCDYDYLPKSEWSYAYGDAPLTVEECEVADVPFSSVQPPVTVKASVYPIAWGLEDGYEKVCAKVPLSREPLGEAREIVLYPYGCAKLRMTELPLAD